MATTYRQIAETDLPAGVRFDVPPAEGGQAIEVAYADAPRTSASLAARGAEYKRITDRSVGPRAVTYYRRAAQ